MSTQYINNIKNALLLMETPFHNSYTTKENFQKHTANVNTIINNNSSTATKIGDDEYHNVIGGNHFYYHLVNNEPMEFSFVTNNTQNLTSKRDGDVKHVHNFMHHHIKTNGFLNSSNDHSDGAKEMWQKFITNNKQYKFSLHDQHGNKIKDIDHEDDTENLWTKKLDPKNIDSHSYIKVSK